MDIEFKEKSFERQFSVEVGRQTNILYSPDQYDEQYLGFDDAFRVPLKHLPDIVPSRPRRPYNEMSGAAIRTPEHIREHLGQRIPEFRFNVYAQYKRPVYLKTRGAKQWPEWRQMFYRYKITPHQQKLLSEIEDKSQGRATAIYASPAFWSAKSLWQHIENGTVIKKGIRNLWLN